MNSFPKSSRSGVLVSAAGVFGSAFLWLLSFKAVALWMGPEGVGLFSQLRQMAQAATVGATYGGTNFVVQGLSERSAEIERRQFRVKAARLVGITGMIVVLGLVAGAPQLASFFLSSTAPDMVATVRWIGLAVLLNIGGTYALAVLNGYRSYPYLAIAQVSGPVAMMIVLTGAWWFRLPADAFFLVGSFVLCFGVTCLAGAVGVTRLAGSKRDSVTAKLTRAQNRMIVRFALSNLFAALSATVALLLIRSWVINAKGLAFSGLFDAGWTLTFNYTTLFLTACNAVYLPLLTAANDLERQKACMLKTAYLVLGAGVLMCYAMVLWKEPLIDLLYSPQFRLSGQVLDVLVIAIILRGISWVYGTMILATRNVRVLLISDTALNLGLLVTVKLALLNFSSLASLAWAFVLPNFLYLVFVVEYASYKNPLMRRRHIWPLLCAAAAPLMLAAMGSPERVQVWGSAQWTFMIIGIIVGGASLFAYKKVAL